MKYKKACPECGGTEIFATTVDAAGNHGPDLLPDVEGSFVGISIFKRKYFELFICGNCGYAQFFVPMDHIDGVKEHYQRMGKS